MSSATAVATVISRHLSQKSTRERAADLKAWCIAAVFAITSVVSMLAHMTVVVTDMGHEFRAMWKGETQDIIL